MEDTSLAGGWIVYRIVPVFHKLEPTLPPVLPLPSHERAPTDPPPAAAQAVRKYIDKMIGLSKRGDLHARRQALGCVFCRRWLVYLVCLRV